MKRSYYTVRVAIVIALALGVMSSAAVAAEQPDCSEALKQVPRDGSAVVGDTVLVSYTGSTSYGGLVDVSREDVELSGPGAPEALEPKEDVLVDARSFVGAQVVGLEEGEYQWRMGDGAEGGFVVESEDAETAAPTMGDGEVEAQMELITYEEFPVLYREWKLRFPAGQSDTTDPENLRYLVEFSWGEGEEAMTRRVLVTPPSEALADTIEVELGGEAANCHHAEPEVPPTEESEIAVYAVDLGGTLSEEPARGVFEGVSAETLAEAYEEFRAVADSLEDDDGEATTTEEMAAQLEAEDEEDNGGCSTVGGGSGPGMVLGLLVLVGAFRRPPRRK